MDRLGNRRVSFHTHKKRLRELENNRADVTEKIISTLKLDVAHEIPGTCKSCFDSEQYPCADHAFDPLLAQHTASLG